MLQAARQMNFSFLESDGETRLANPEGVSSKNGLRGKDDRWTNYCRKLVHNLGLGELGERLEVEWNTRMRSCAGRAFWPLGVIQLNPRLAEISRTEIRRTALHELAHLVAYERYPHRSIKGHGREWRRACADLGIPGEKATHDLALPSRSLKRRWKYQCPECSSSFERVRRYKGAVACYECCLKTNGGVFDASFQLREIPLAEEG